MLPKVFFQHTILHIVKRIMRMLLLKVTRFRMDRRRKAELIKKFGVYFRLEHKVNKSMGKLRMRSVFWNTKTINVQRRMNARWNKKINILYVLRLQFCKDRFRISLYNNEISGGKGFCKTVRIKLD